MPVSESAPSVQPWYAPRRAITLRRSGSPRPSQWWRTSLSAESTASEPPDVKKTRVSRSGASAATRSVSASGAGEVAAQFG